MGFHRLTTIVLVGMAFLGEPLLGRPVDLSAPSGELGATDLKGNLQLWREIEGAGLDLGKGSYLPLRYKFSSDDNVGGIFGPGFYVPMFEARNTLIREDTMRVSLPCGKSLYLWKDQVDPDKFKSVDNEWSGYLNGEDFTLWRDDGWKILYRQGRLSSITTDENHVFTWDYDFNSHMAKSISKDGQSLITVEPNQQGLADTFVFDGKRYELGYSERPLVEMILGQPGIKQLAIALSSFKYPDGRMETFKFVLTTERVPTLTFTAPDQKQTIYTWDTATNHILDEKGPNGNWTYKIGDVASDFGLPPMARTNSSGKVESIAVDTKMGTYTEQAADGTITVTHIFETPGPLYRKVQKIEKISGKNTTVIYRASFDETGKLLRAIDQKGVVTSFVYDAQGELKGQTLSLSQDPKFMDALHKKEVDLLALLSSSKSIYDKDSHTENLALFYICNMRDPAKALALAPKITQKVVRYDVELMAANHDDSLSYSQKIDRYKALENEFPEQKGDLDNLIKQSQTMVDAGL